MRFHDEMVSGDIENAFALELAIAEGARMLRLRNEAEREVAALRTANELLQAELACFQPPIREVTIGGGWILGLDGYIPGEPLAVHRMDMRSEQESGPISTIVRRSQKNT